MKIKKTFQGTVPENKILNTESSSETDTYSCKYINDTSVVVSSTEPTGNNRKKVWMQKGKNLLDLSNKFSETTYRGLAIAKNEDGSITFNGTTTEEFILRIPVYLTLDKGTYTHSTTTLSDGIYLSLDNINDTMVTPSTSSKTFTLEEKTTYSKYFIWIASGKTLNNYTFYPMICEGTDSIYEEYIERKIYVKNNNGVYEEFMKKDEGEVYSTEEVRIGTWIDGKPLYRKVVEYTPTTIIGETGKVTDIYIPHKISNFKQLCGQKCITSDGYILPTLGSKTEATLDYGTCIRAVTEGTINLRLVNDSFGIRTWYITLEYTKTTD